MKFNKQKFGARLEFARDGEPKIAVQRATGIQTVTLRKYEIGEMMPSAEKLAILCTHYKVSADWLMWGTGDIRRE